MTDNTQSRPVLYMNGAGNDFMVLDARGLKLDFPKAAVTLCRLTGADGFMALDTSEIGDFRLHFYNSDGSRGEMCGNGARCICRFAYDHGIAGAKMVVQTDAGPVPGERLAEDRYRVRLNTPGILDLNRTETAHYVELGSPGVPHAVVEYSGDLWADRDELKERMRALRFHPAFPKGANVNFYQWIAPGEVRMLTFERGVEDFTLACGTGCGSTASALRAGGQLPGGVLTCHNRGGDLTVTVEGRDGRVERLLLEGPAEVGQSYELPRELL